MKKRIALPLSLAMVFMFSAVSFAAEPVDSSEPALLYEPGLGYEVDLDNPSDSEVLGLPYVEGLGYEVVIPDGSGDMGSSASDTMQAGDVAEINNYDSGWKSFLGGKWKHGVNNTKVYSTFKHSTKTHHQHQETVNIL